MRSRASSLLVAGRLGATSRVRGSRCATPMPTQKRMAKAAAEVLGNLLELSTAERSGEAHDGLDASRAAAANAIEPGQLTISATVTARWVFVPEP